MAIGIKSAKQKLIFLLLLISGIAFASAVFLFYLTVYKAPGFAAPSRFIFSILAILLLVESFGAVGIARHWFDHFFLRTGKIIKIFQWLAGFLAAAGVFDFIAEWHRQWWLDGILIAVFLLWMIVSYFIQKDVKERKVCEFC
ncbi:hypothetical protein HYW83_03285 [Candidatus Peregrinibacteria bacterium]|nr:hypothetical protein [Candidatus Peregrinibacteria bacterium]